METLSYADILSLGHATSEIYGVLDLESFYSTVFMSIRNLIPYELCSFNNVSLAPTSFLKVVSSSQSHQNVINRHFPSLNAYIHEHPLFTQFNSNHVFKTTDVVTKKQFMASAIYNEYYRYLNTETQIGFSIPISQKTISIIALSRSSSDFTERDRLMLSLLKPHCVNALRNVTEIDRLRLERDFLHKATKAQRQGVLLCQQNGLIIGVSELARDMCSRYFAITLSDGDTLPKAFAQWLEKAAGDTGATKRPESSAQRVERNDFMIEKDGKRLAIKLMNDVTTGDCILIMTESDPATLFRNLQRYALSPRETDVIRWLVKGKTNAEIAIILEMSKRTVDKHMEHIFVKFGVVTRTAAVALIRNECDTNI